MQRVYYEKRHLSLKDSASKYECALPLPTRRDVSARTLFWKYYFFTLRIELLKTLAVGEISSFLRRRNFAVVYSMWNSPLSINHIKGKGLGDISSWHILAWVNEKASRADSHRWREIISILCAVSPAVKFHGGRFSFPSKTNQRTRCLGKTLKTWAALHFFNPPPSPWPPGSSCGASNPEFTKSWKLSPVKVSTSLRANLWKVA